MISFKIEIIILFLKKIFIITIIHDIIIKLYYQ